MPGILVKRSILIAVLAATAPLSAAPPADKALIARALADPAAAMDALAAFLDRPAPPAEEALRRITPDRRHERVPAIDGDGGCPDAVRTLFAALRAAVGPRGLRSPADGASLDATAAAVIGPLPG